MLFGAGGPARKRRQRPSSPADSKNPTFPELSEKLELDRDLVPCAEVRFTPDFGFDRQQVAAAVQREDGSPPDNLADARFHLHRPKAARVAEGVRADLIGLLF